MPLALLDNDPLISVTDPSSTTHTVDIDTVTAKQVGDWLLFVSVVGASTTTVEWAHPTIINWPGNLNNGFVSLVLSYVYVDATLEAATTVNYTVNSGEGTTFVYHLRGGNLEWITPRFSHSVSGGTTTSPNPPALTPGYGNQEYLWIAGVYHSASGSTSAAPTNYTNLATSETGNVGLATAIRTLTAASEDPGTFTWGTARTAGQFTLGLQTAEPTVAAGFPTPQRRITTQVTASNTLTFPLPADLSGLGTILICCARQQTWSTPSGWTLLGAEDDPLDVVEYAAFYRMGGGGNTNVVAASSTFLSGVALVFDDVNFSTAPPTIEMSAAASSATVDPPEETFASGDYCVICGDAHTVANSWSTEPANYLNMVTVRTGRAGSSANDALIENTFRFVTGTSENPGTYTISAARTQVAYTIAVPGVVGAQNIAVGQAVEVETANPISPVIDRLVPIGQAAEAETANPITALISRQVLVGQATERELARTITPQIAGEILVPLGQATERELARTITPFIQGLVIGDIECTVLQPTATCAILSPSVKCEVV